MQSVGGTNSLSAVQVGLGFSKATTSLGMVHRKASDLTERDGNWFITEKRLQIKLSQGRRTEAREVSNTILPWDPSSLTLLSVSVCVVCQRKSPLTQRPDWLMAQ